MFCSISLRQCVLINGIANFKRHVDEFILKAINLDPDSVVF